MIFFFLNLKNWLYELLLIIGLAVYTACMYIKYKLISIPSTTTYLMFMEDLASIGLVFNYLIYISEPSYISELGLFMFIISHILYIVYIWTCVVYKKYRILSLGCLILVLLALYIEKFDIAYSGFKYLLTQNFLTFFIGILVHSLFTRLISYIDYEKILNEYTIILSLGWSFLWYGIFLYINYILTHYNQPIDFENSVDTIQDIFGYNMICIGLFIGLFYPCIQHTNTVDDSIKKT